jgi:hypothetical protein
MKRKKTCNECKGNMHSGTNPWGQLIMHDDWECANCGAIEKKRHRTSAKMKALKATMEELGFSIEDGWIVVKS